MIRPRPILHVLIVFLATNIPEGASVAGSVCTGETGSGCWQEITNLPGCHVWNANPQEEETVTWSGDCLDGKSSGTGKLTWHVKNSAGDNVTFTAEGPMVDGKRHGNWVLRTADGDVIEGPYVDDKRHGHWVLRTADGGVHEGPYVDGKQHGHWVLRTADGDVSEGPYVDGKRHGNWVLRTADGGVSEGPMVDGKWHGHWVLRFADGDVSEGPFVDDKQHGNWVLRTADGDVAVGPYVDGKQHGHWVQRFAVGDEGPYVDGKRHGHWVERFANGDVHEGPYVDGQRHGKWVHCLDDDGVVVDVEYVDGERRVEPWNVLNWIRRIVSGPVGRTVPDCTDFLRTLPTEGASAVGSP